MIERLRALQASLGEQFEAMSTRDRWYAVALVLTLALVVTGGASWFLVTTLNAQASRVRAAKENLVVVQDLANDYALLRVRLDAAESRMAEFKTSQINTYISQWATTAGLSTNLQGIREGGTRQASGFREQSYNVEIDAAQLDNLTRFLYALETAPYPMKVRNATFSTKARGGERSIDLDLEIVAYSKEPVP